MFDIAVCVCLLRVVMDDGTTGKRFWFGRICQESRLVPFIVLLWVQPLTTWTWCSGALSTYCIASLDAVIDNIEYVEGVFSATSTVDIEYNRTPSPSISQSG